MRSFLFVPGDSVRKFDSAKKTAADALILDLEDSIAPEGKVAARGITRQMLDDRNPAQKMYIRVNAFDTDMTLGDLAAAREFYMEALKLGAAPTTLLQVGMTYDPVIYAANKVAGLSPDKQIALEYYRQADKAGVTAARDAIARLEAWTQN